MSVKEQIQNQMKEAMKSKNSAALKTLREIKSEILKLETTGKEFSEEDIKALFRRLIKQHTESMEMFANAGREDEVAEEKGAIELIKSYLPQQVTGDALAQVVKEAVEAVGAETMRDMGKVMGKVKASGIEADGKELSELVKKALA